MRQHLFNVAVSKSHPKITASAGEPTPATITTKTGGISKKKEKARVTFCKLGGGVWEENAYIISQCLILYPNISGRTRRIRNNIRPVHFISHNNTGGFCKYIRVRQLWEPDRLP